jgi:hypothetical protein
MRVR